MEDRKELNMFREMCRAATGYTILDHVKIRLMRDPNYSLSLRESLIIICNAKDECNDAYYKYMKEYSNA